MINALNVGESFIFGERSYSVTRIITSEKYRNIYFIWDGSHYYVIKELLATSRILSRKSRRDDFSGQVVFADGFEPDNDFKPLNNREIKANDIAVRDKENNSAFLFPTKRLKNIEPRASVYLIIYSVTGDSLNAIRKEWDQDLREEKLTEKEIVFQTVDITIKAARALENTLHHKDLIHLDIKPQNLYWTGDKTVKLLDLGSAFPIGKKYLTDDTFEAIQSTLMYQSPLLSALSSEYSYYNKNWERIYDLSKNLSAKEDIYALAKTMTFLLTGTENIGKLYLQDEIFQSEVRRVLTKATTGAVIEADGRSFNTGEYDNCAELIHDLEILKEILENKGMHDAVIRHKGEALVRQLMHQQHLELQEDLIPDIQPLE